MVCIQMLWNGGSHYVSSFLSCSFSGIPPPKEAASRKLTSTDGTWPTTYWLMDLSAFCADADQNFLGGLEILYISHGNIKKLADPACASRGFKNPLRPSWFRSDRRRQQGICTSCLYSSTCCSKSIWNLYWCAKWFLILENHFSLLLNETHTSRSRHLKITREERQKWKKKRYWRVYQSSSSVIRHNKISTCFLILNMFTRTSHETAGWKITKQA